ncbi:DUF166 family protein [Methanothermobacter wolfeii]|uniref:DUF166 family protein n=1 Tax=Methanothermobacter wolfeii TaxID=145261 RepID=A0ABU8TU70_METWO
MRIIMVSGGEYGKRVVNTVAEHGFASSMVAVFEYPDETPEFLDDPSSLVPESVSDADLTVAAGLRGDLNLVAAEIAAKSGAESLIIESHTPTQLPDGLKNEIKSMFRGRIAFPVPFCSLEPSGDRYIDEFAERLGRPLLEIRSGARIGSVRVKRSAPCGSTFYIADELSGSAPEDAEILAGEKLHNYPCLASMDTDPGFGDTHLHIAGYLTREAVKRATGIPGAHGVVDPEVCQGYECGFLCRDVCPLVRLSHDTVTMGEHAVIDPFSCGACGRCVKECPYGAIELIEGQDYRS